MSKKPIHAIATFIGKKIQGTVHFYEKNDEVEISVDLQGLHRSSQHGFHVHEYGDMSEHCDSMCGHFNPYGKNHGAQEANDRHVGDLGNLHSDSNGCAKYVFRDSIIKLRGTKSNIIGRGLIIHDLPDDLGLGNNSASLINGNAGKRIACSVIGYARP